MVHNPGGDWNPGRGDNPIYGSDNGIVTPSIIAYIVSTDPPVDS